MNSKLLIKQYNTLPEHLQLLVFGYVDFLVETYQNILKKEPGIHVDDIPEEVKLLLNERISKNEQNPENVKSWKEVEKRLLNKYKQNAI